MQALVNEARRLDAEASAHKRKISAHRQALKRAREAQRRLEARCSALGIEVTYSKDDFQKEK